MTNLINKLLLFLKIILLIAGFALNLYIMLYMYYNLDKKPFGSDFVDFAASLLPFVILLILLVINLSAKQKVVNNNLFYNLTSCVVLIAILYMQYRSMFDPNMILKYKTSYGINFDYYADQLFQIKAMIYGLSVANVFLIIENNLSKKKKLDIYD